MKKILKLFLTCAVMLNIPFFDVLATIPDYSCYNGTWVANPNISIYEDHRGIDIIRTDNTSMDFTFFWYQFGVEIKDAKIDGTTVHGKYYEVWDDGVDWDNYVIQGDVILTLGKTDINISWIGKENGMSVSHEFKVYNPDFKYIEPSAITVMLNGSELSFDQPPTIIKDRVMVPIRTIFEAMGYDVNWNQHNQTAIASNGVNNITVQINNSAISYTGGTYYCDVAPQIISNRTLVPVRAIAESAGCNVEWDSVNQKVIITK